MKDKHSSHSSLNILNIFISQYTEKIKRGKQLKGTVVEISSDPPVKEAFIRFTTVPFQPISD